MLNGPLQGQHNEKRYYDLHNMLNYTRKAHFGALVDGEFVCFMAKGLAGRSYPFPGENHFNPRKETADSSETSVSVHKLHIIKVHKNTMCTKPATRA
jgi:hypothetical protein